jgi:hypothetical protein
MIDHQSSLGEMTVGFSPWADANVVKADTVSEEGCMKDFT